MNKNKNINNNEIKNFNIISYSNCIVTNQRNRYISSDTKKNIIKNSLAQKNLHGQKKKRRYQDGCIGLLNIGNTCFLNSVLQNLKNIFILTKYLFEINNFYINGFAQKYFYLLANLINQEHTQFYSPKELYSKLLEKSSIFQSGQQNDSTFAIIIIINLLEKELKDKKKTNINNFQELIYNNNLNTEEKNKLNAFINKILLKKDQKIFEIFYGFNENIIQCKNCKKKNFSFQIFNVLNLPIIKNNNDKIINLEDAINYYQEKQNNKNNCQFNCCINNDIEIQTKIIGLPKILIINFKRVGELSFYNHKIKIDFNLEMGKLIHNKNYSNYNYELIGFINHLGNEYSGHNIAFCKNFFDDHWYQYNDSLIKNVNVYDIPKEAESNGFLFFYKMKGIDITDDEKKYLSNTAEQIRKKNINI